LMLCTRSSIVVATGLVVGLLLEIEFFWQFWPFGMQLNLLASSMIFGCLLALLDARGVKAPSWTAIPFILLGLIAAAQYTLLWDKVGGALLLIGLLSLKTPPLFLTGRFGRWLGELSFPLYLVHTVILLSAGTIVFVFAHDRGWGGAVATVMTFMVVGIVSVALSWWIIKVERWWIPMMNRFAKRIV